MECESPANRLFLELDLSEVLMPEVKEYRLTEHVKAAG
jgi:hypothetical protein